MAAVRKLILYMLVMWTTMTEPEGCYGEREHGAVETRQELFAEASRKIVNPNRGFYGIYGFSPSDGATDLQEQVVDKIPADDRAIAMIQINLKEYSDGPISEAGLQNIRDIFQALRGLNKQYIIRFLYDWSGKAAQTEPENVEIILEHMRQLESVFKEYSDIIFIQQGLFIGDCGEMHGTDYLDDIPQLAAQLAAVTAEKTFLAVRTPAQWRTVTNMEEATGEAREASSLLRRLGLFNDGMMGSSSDCGTYGSAQKAETDIYHKWSREDELAFQENLCKLVPNGGEVIIENSLNDFESAVEHLRTMRVTYLNRDYDQEVLNKWAGSVYTGNDCFYGMDGLSYIERHLGYRLLISENVLKYYEGLDILCLSLKMKNVGFAPMYKEPRAAITVFSKADGRKFFYELDTSLCSLSGGNDFEETLPIIKNIVLTGYLPGAYEVYLSIWDEDSGSRIVLANEQEPGRYGYLLGSFRIKALE